MPSDNPDMEIEHVIIDGGPVAPGEPFILGSWDYPIDRSLSREELARRIAVMNPDRSPQDVEAFVSMLEEEDRADEFRAE